MSITNVIVRFSIAYVLLNIIVTVALGFLGLKSNSGASIGIIIGATMYACTAFGKKNGVYFDNEEKIKVVAGFALVNFIVKMLGSYVFLKAASMAITMPIVIAGIVEAGILHTLVIYFFVGITEKQLERQGIITDEPFFHESRRNS